MSDEAAALEARIRMGEVGIKVRWRAANGTLPATTTGFFMSPARGRAAKVFIRFRDQSGEPWPRWVPIADLEVVE